jgi:hypothetical protein
MGQDKFDFCLRGHTSFIHTLAVPTPSSELLVSVDSKGVVIVWAHRRGVEVARWKLEAETHKLVIYSPETSSHSHRPEGGA